MKIHRALLFAACSIAVAGCADSGEPRESVEQSGEALAAPVGLGLYFANGVFNPDLNPAAPTGLHVFDGAPRFVQELYMISTAPSTPEAGLTPIMTAGDFSKLDWSGVTPKLEDWRLNFDGVTWIHETFYRGAAWMKKESVFVVLPIDSKGGVVGLPLLVNAGEDDEWRHTDSSFERRFNARVITSNCVAKFDCSNAGTTTTAEGLVQLRANLFPAIAGLIPKSAARLDIVWSQNPTVHRTVDLVHDAQADTGSGYGFAVSMQELSPPARGYYLAGESVNFQLKYTDGSGKPLFPVGSLPTYGEMLNRTDSSRGLRYLNFTDLPILYWAHKALQGDLPISISGPLDHMKTVGTVPITPASLFEPQIPGADVASDGYTSLVQVKPSSAVTFTCLFGLGGLPGGDVAACSAPVSDSFSFTLPAEVLPGTYNVATKARRDWKGEPTMRAASTEIQVGTAQKTPFAGLTIPGINNDCGSCHQGSATIERVHHGFPGLNKVGPQCMSACHTKGYYFEPDADIVTRLQIMHTATNRLGPPH